MRHTKIQIPTFDNNNIFVNSLYLGVKYENATDDDKEGNILFPYPGSIAVALSNYANFHEDCINASVTMFMQWSPYIILIEVIWK